MKSVLPTYTVLVCTILRYNRMRRPRGRFTGAVAAVGQDLRVGLGVGPDGPVDRVSREISLFLKSEKRI